MKVCRVCLAMGVKMYHMSEHNLKVVYKQVTGVKINTEDKLPKMLCWECVARLSSAHTFIKKALKTNLILVDKMNSSKFITMDDLEFIDKSELKSTLGVKFYKNNHSYLHIVKETDNCYKESEAEFSEPNYVDINESPKEEQMFVVQDIVSVERDPIKKEYLDGNEDQISKYESNIEAAIIIESDEIKFQTTECKTEMLEISVTEDASDEEVMVDNESEATKMFEEKYIKVEPAEVYDPLKQKIKRRGALRHKEMKVAVEDVMLSENEHNTQDNAQSTNDYNFSQGRINDNIVFKNESSCSDTLTFSMNTVDVQMGFPDAASSNDLLICDKSLRNDKHTNNSVFTCNHCTFETSVKSRLTYHTNTKHRKRSFNCDHCDFVSNVKSRLLGHINAKHTKNIAFNCSYCSFNTYFKNNLDRHINSKHTKSNVFNCSYCSYKTFIKCKLSAHVNDKHTKIKVFKCSFCDYEAYNRNSLTKHVNIKHTKTNIFACSYCSYETYQQSNLNAHLNAKHTRNLSFNCSHCDYKTYNKDLLKGHINSKHTKTNVFKCSFCDHETCDKRHLKVHINAKHTKANVFTCSFCSYKSYQQSNVNAHVNAKHTKTNVFPCSLCDYKAYHKMHLKRHINSNHTKVNVFICSYCNLQVYYKSTLIRHIKTKHS